jgi:hypothetical protein
LRLRVLPDTWNLALGTFNQRPSVIELGMPPVSQRAGEFQGRAEAFSGSKLPQPLATKEITARRRKKIHGKLTAKRFTTRDKQG